MWNIMSQMQEKILYDIKLETITLNRIPWERLKQIMTMERWLFYADTVNQKACKNVGFYCLISSICC